MGYNEGDTRFSRPTPQSTENSRILFVPASKPMIFASIGDTMANRESDLQSRVVRKLRERLPGAQIFKGDTRYQQGTPDLIILYEDRWAILEVKRSRNASKQPNQEFYVDKLNDMSYAAFIFPENEEDILHEVQRALQATRRTCVS